MSQLGPCPHRAAPGEFVRPLGLMLAPEALLALLLSLARPLGVEVQRDAADDADDAERERDREAQKPSEASVRSATRSIADRDDRASDVASSIAADSGVFGHSSSSRIEATVTPRPRPAKRSSSGVPCGPRARSRRWPAKSPRRGPRDALERGSRRAGRLRVGGGWWLPCPFATRNIAR